MAASVSIDGEEYVPRRIYEETQAERDRLAEEVDRLRELVEHPGSRERDEPRESQ